MIETKRLTCGPVISVSHLSKKFCKELRRPLLYGLVKPDNAQASVNQLVTLGVGWE